MANTQKSYVYKSNDYWRYDDGLMYESILDTYEHYKNGGSNIGDETLKNAVKAYIDKCIDSNGNLLDKYEDNTLDDIRPARMVYKYYKLYGGSNLLTACQTVMNCAAFSDNYRVINHSTGYPWQHKSSYAHQVWLDGIFMGLPYWTLAGPDGVHSSHHTSWTANDYFNDAYNQMQITDEKTYEPEIGLWCHAWDEYFESTTNTPQYWSMKNGKFTTGTFKDYHTTYEKTRHEGRSSHCWGRAAGWFAMAIMETMDNISAVDANYTHLTDLQTLFKKVIDAVWEKRDPTTGMWRCVLDVDDSTGDYKAIKEATGRENYLEATCSAMFTYCLLHGVAKGYLPSSYLDKAKSSYQGLINTFITTDGGLKLNNCMEVGGLGGTTKIDDTTYDRDGSFAYYTIEKRKANDSKGVGPFIWASLEAEKIGYNMETNSFGPIDENTIVTFAWSKASDEITQGASYTSPTFTARSYGNDTPLTNSSEIDFESSNTDVATVAADGTVTPVGIGTATITAALKTGSNYTWSGTNPTYTITVNAPDVTAPTLSSSTPVSGTTNIATSGNIVLTFSEAVTVADASKFTLSGGTGSLTTGSITGDGTTTITIPYTGLANETSYTFATAAGAVQDASGNPNAALSNILFTTAVATSSATFDFTGGSTEGLTISKSGTTANVSYLVTNETYNQIPTLSEGNYFLGVNFTNNSAGVLDVITTDSYTNITSISFDCAADNNSNPKVAIYIIDSDNKETEIQNAMVLSSGSTKVWRSNKSGVDVYTLDLSSSPKTGKVHFKFTTGSADKSGAIDNIVITTASSSSDTTAPTFTTSPANSATNVAVDAAVTLTADENIFAVGGTINGTLNGTACTFNLTERVLTLPHDAFANNTTYTVVLNANQIQDAAGNKNAETSFSFTTEAAEQEQVATPNISGNTSFTDNTSVTITCATDGATIYYTTDGTAPTSSSTEYTEAIPLTATTTINAIAIKSGMTDSEVATQTFTKNSGGGETTSATITIGNSKSTSYAATFTSSSTNEHITADAKAFTTGSSMTTSSSTYSSATAPYSIKYKPSSNINTSEYSDAYSVSAQFTVANGYTFTPTAISTTIVTEAANYTYQAVLTDGTTTYTSNDISSSNNGVSTFVFPSLSGTALSGTVTYKIRFKSTANNTKFFVVNLPITITGTVSSSSTPSPTTYNITATSNNDTWGAVSVDKNTATKGATVTITTSPAEGYELTSLTATDGESNDVTITNNQFTMPASNVTVNATFAALPPVLGAVTFSPAGGNYSSEQNVTISATNAEEIWYSTVSQADAVKNGANATQYTSAIHIGEGSTTLYATAYLGESTTTGSATYTVTIPDVGDGTEIYEFTINSSPKTITFAYGDDENISITNSSCEQGKNEKGYDHSKDIKFNWHNTSKNTQGKFTINSSSKPIQSIKLVATIEGDEQNAWGEETEHQVVTVTPNGTYDSETMTWTANSDNVTSVTFTNNYSASYNGNIYISKIIVVYYAPETITIAEAGFSTLYKTYAVSVGDGGTAYYVSDIRNKNVVLTPFANNIIPANTGAVIKGTFGDEVTLNRAIADEFTTTNYLLGTDTKQNITADKDNYYYFISGRQKQADNSYKYGWLVPNALKTTSVFSNNANKAYLRVPKAMLDNETSARILSLIWEDVEQPITTGLNRHNYQFVIDDKTPIYNLSGQRVSKDYKGIVIVNGKKFVRK